METIRCLLAFQKYEHERERKDMRELRTVQLMSYKQPFSHPHCLTSSCTHHRSLHCCWTKCWTEAKVDTFLVLLQRINASLSPLQAKRKTAACRRMRQKQIVWAMSSALYPQAISHRAAKSGSGVGFPWGTQRAALSSLSLHIQCKGHTRKEGNQTADLFTWILQRPCCCPHGSSRRSSSQPNNLGATSFSQYPHWADDECWLIPSPLLAVAH